MTPESASKENLRALAITCPLISEFPLVIQRDESDILIIVFFPMQFVECPGGDRYN